MGINGKLVCPKCGYKTSFYTCLRCGNQIKKDSEDLKGNPNNIYIKIEERPEPDIDESFFVEETSNYITPDELAAAMEKESKTDFSEDWRSDKIDSGPTAASQPPKPAPKPPVKKAKSPETTEPEKIAFAQVSAPKQRKSATKPPVKKAKSPNIMKREKVAFARVSVAKQRKTVPKPPVKQTIPTKITKPKEIKATRVSAPKQRKQAPKPPVKQAKSPNIMKREKVEFARVAVAKQRKQVPKPPVKQTKPPETAEHKKTAFALVSAPKQRKQAPKPPVKQTITTEITKPKEVNAARVSAPKQRKQAPKPPVKQTITTEITKPKEVNAARVSTPKQRKQAPKPPVKQAITTETKQPPDSHYARVLAAKQRNQSASLKPVKPVSKPFIPVQAPVSKPLDLPPKLIPDFEPETVRPPNNKETQANGKTASKSFEHVKKLILNNLKDIKTLISSLWVVVSINNPFKYSKPSLSVKIGVSLFCVIIILSFMVDSGMKESNIKTTEAFSYQEICTPLPTKIIVREHKFFKKDKYISAVMQYKPFLSTNNDTLPKVMKAFLASHYDFNKMLEWQESDEGTNKVVKTIFFVGRLERRWLGFEMNYKEPEEKKMLFKWLIDNDGNIRPGNVAAKICVIFEKMNRKELTGIDTSKEASFGDVFTLHKDYQELLKLDQAYRSIR